MSLRTKEAGKKRYYNIVFFVTLFMLAFTVASYADFSKATILLDSAVTSDVGNKATAADFDNDGNDEIFIANNGQDRLLKYNADTQEFDSLPLPIDSDDSKGIAVGYIDGDTYLDIIVANFEGQSRVLINDGDGTFTDETSTWLPSETMAAVSASLGDIDNDGDLDLVIGLARPSFENSESVDTIKVYINNGSAFTDATSTWIPSPSANWVEKVILEDLNNDSKADLLVFVGLNNPNYLYMSSGTTFTDETATRFPTVITSTNTVTSAAIGDLTGDGAPDIYITKDGNNKNMIYINDGSGTFTDETITRLPDVSDYGQDVSISDVNGDGNLDIVVANGGEGGLNPNPPYEFNICYADGHSNAVYLNNGSGIFTAASTSFFEDTDNQYSTGVVAGEFGAADTSYILFTNACSGGPALWSSGSVASPTPAISSFSPDTIAPYAALTISGENFGADKGSVTFTSTNVTGTISAASTEITSWSDTVITLTVPFGANTGDVTVTRLSDSSVSAPATLTISNFKPKITKSPKTGKRGKSITIIGSNFGNSKKPSGAKAGSVTIGGKAATIKSWSNKKIVAVINKNAKKGKQKIILKTHYGTVNKAITVK
ncbi:MAG: VCBS repeat-containing protein [Candidatus Schekmanbacteria bacterium]|nr:VCBS repeat-containing protein [Candidatus Schekmanbacteria bacterium]